jgi:hypothetical protein
MWIAAVRGVTGHVPKIAPAAITSGRPTIRYGESADVVADFVHVSF